MTQDTQIADELDDEFMDGDLAEDDDWDNNANKYLNLLLGEENYGINISYVIEIIGYQKITALPEVPDFVKGVINLRGKIIPVIDVRLRFGLPPIAYNERTCIIVVNVEENLAGLIVDQVNEVIDIPEDQVLSSVNLAGKSGNQFIMGLGKIAENVKILLDVNKLLNEKDFRLESNQLA